MTDAYLALRASYGAAKPGRSVAMKRGLVAIASISFASAAIGQARLPEDVARFIERRDSCDHFRGEEAYDAKRREFLEQQTLQLCVGSDKQLAELKKKYGGNKTVMTTLNEYEAQIEGPSEK